MRTGCGLAQWPSNPKGKRSRPERNATARLADMVTCSGQRLAAARRMVLPRGAGTARRLSWSGCKIYGHPAPQWHVRVACPARLRRTGAPAPLPAPPVEARTPLMRDPVFLGLSLVFRRRCSQRFLRWSRGRPRRPQTLSRCCGRSTPRLRTSRPRRRPATAGSRPGHPLAGGKPQARACRSALRSRAFRQVTITPGAAPAAAVLGHDPVARLEPPPGPGRGAAALPGAGDDGAPLLPSGRPGRPPARPADSRSALHPRGLPAPPARSRPAGRASGPEEARPGRGARAQVPPRGARPDWIRRTSARSRGGSRHSG